VRRVAGRPLPQRGRRDGAAGHHRTSGETGEHNARPSGILRPPGPYLRAGFVLGSTGSNRLYSHVEGGSLPPQSRDEVRASIATASNLRSTIDEYVQANTSMEQAAALRDFGDKPLVVLTAGSGSDAASIAAHDKLAALSTNSVHRVIDGADHEGLIVDEQHSAATTRAVLDVVSSVRSGVPLVS
jgi:hypothetical protein